MSDINPVLLIQKKRDGGVLSREEIDLFIKGYVDGSVPDYQMAAMAMAIYFRDMTPEETVALTETMLRSGALLARPAQNPSPKPRVDKHSTGGVGDKISLPLAPLLASCGVVVPMISGRGLGATGGTLDKLDAIPGFRSRLSVEEVNHLLDTVGVAMAGQTNDLVPADRKLYALRDVTATVPSVPLITASIMSKKLAESLDALVLDVKWGSGAFMKTMQSAGQLADAMVRVGRLAGLRTTAMITDMNQPLGRMAGHVGEVLESLEILQGRGPADVAELTLTLGAELLTSVGVTRDIKAGADLLRSKILSGEGLAKFREMVRAQGGRLDELPPLAETVEVLAPRPGYVVAINAEQIGLAIITLGGGRTKITDTLDYTVGAEICARIGDRVVAGKPLARLFARQRGMPQAVELVASAFQIADRPPEKSRLIVEVIRSF